jgi:hypothetical protein
VNVEFRDASDGLVDSGSAAVIAQGEPWNGVDRIDMADRKGKARFQVDPKTPSWIVLWTNHAQLPSAAAFEAPAADGPLRLPSLAPVEGRVVDAGGKGVSAMKIWRRVVPSEAWVLEGFSGADGAFQLSRVPEGEYPLVALRDGNVPSGEQGATVVRGGARGVVLTARTP